MTGTSARSAEVARDGRVLRSERNRKAILEAFYELVGEGVLRPTPDQIAGRAGLASRSVYRHFSDLDSLFAGLTERVVEDLRDLLEVETPDGSLEQRAKAHSVWRCELFERMAPYARARDFNRWRYDWLNEEHATANRRLTDALYAWLPELHRAPNSLRDAIESVLSFEHWDRLRTEQGLGAVRTAAAVELATMSLIVQLPR